MIHFTINPEQLLNQQDIKFHRRGNWLNCKICPFCLGGKQGQQYTFGVRIDDFNYNCLRASCGASGNFWMLLKHFGYDPKEYIDKEQSKFEGKRQSKKRKKNKFVYRSHA